jgi:transposase
LKLNRDSLLWSNRDRRDGMRGSDERSEGLFSYVSCAARVPADHPLRPMRAIVDEALAVLSAEFEALYARIGRPSIAPEKLLRSLLLQAFYSVRSERQLMEQLDYNLLFRWFVGLSMDAPIWDVTVFTKNRERLLAGDIAAKFMAAVLSQPRVKALLSDEHFSADGTLIEAWASMKSFRRKGEAEDDPPSGGRNAESDFRGEKRSNQTHASTTDPEARLYRKATRQNSVLCFMGHLLMENRNGLIVDAELTQASGTAEREATLAMLDRRKRRRRITVGADKAYDVAEFVAGLRQRKVTPHIARNDYPTRTGKPRSSAIDRRATRHSGYAVSQRVRKRIEESFAWIKEVGGLAQTRHRGLARVGWMFALTAAACNLVRLPKLLAAG